MSKSICENLHLLVLAVLFAAFGFAAPSSALAGMKGPDAGIFTDRLEAVLASGSAEKQILFDRHSGAAQVNNDQLNMFTLGARRQANIWADTILEGDYAAAGNTEIDTVEAVLNNREIVAYRITYSERAWYTGDCDSERDLNACSEGRIVESAYVSPAATTWLEDSASRAKFLSIR